MFPMDWLVTENLRNLRNVKIDFETKIRLKIAYEKMLKDELKAR